MNISGISEDFLEGRVELDEIVPAVNKQGSQSIQEILEGIFGKECVLHYPMWGCWRISVANRQYLLEKVDYYKARDAAERSYNPSYVLRNALCRFLKPLKKAEVNGYK